MAAKKPKAEATPATPNGRARHGTHEHTATRARKVATQRAVDAIDASSVHTTGDSLVKKSTEGIVQLTHDQHPGFDNHRKGHPVDQEVKSLAHIFQPWGNLRSNGSGILAVAAWVKRLEEEGKQSVRDAGQDLEPFIRGLIHR